MSLARTLFSSRTAKETRCARACTAREHSGRGGLSQGNLIRRQQRRADEGDERKRKKKGKRTKEKRKRETVREREVVVEVSR